MANTADILGEQETLDGLVAHTLEDYEDDRITTVRSYAFQRNYGLKSVNLPNATSIGVYAFYDCNNIEDIKIPKVTTITGNLFDRCFNLNSLDISSANKLETGSNFSRCFCLNNVDLSKITAAATDSLSNTGFGNIILPNCTNLGNNIGNGVRTSTIDLSKNITFSINKLSNAYSLVHLILRSDTICPLSSTSAFTNTPIAGGLGWIYVPTDLVDSYKTASNWSTYASQIISIDEYPKALEGETITDTWDEIFQAENNNTYKTKYSVGDTKYLVVGGTYVLMQIIAFDRDILSSDGISTAKITWLSKGLSFEFPMNFTSNITGGWGSSECKKFLNNTIYEQIPQNVKNKILPVNKTYTTSSSPSSTTIVSDKLWIPSAREIFGGNSYENSGIDYTDYFSNSTMRTKSVGLTSVTTSYYLRSVYSLSSFRTVSNIGSISNASASSIVRLALGFCT